MELPPQQEPIVTKTPELPQKSNAFFIILGAFVMLAIGFVCGYIVKENIKTPPQIGNKNISVSPTITTPPKTPSTERSTCEQKFKTEITISKNKDLIYLKDLVNNYELNVSTLPDIAFSEGSGCTKDFYELDIYPQRQDELGQGSVARIQFVESIVIENTTSLEEIAKTKFNYIEGKHVDPKGANYGQAFTSTPLVSSTLANEIKEVSWKDIYTDQATHTEGTTAAKHYLLQVGNKVFSFTLMSWDTPSFNKAVTDFDHVITTFQSPIKS